MKQVGMAVEIIGGIAASSSAFLWWYAAKSQPIPPYVGGLYLTDEPPVGGDTPWRKAWDRSARLNARAAILTGIAAFLGGVGTLLPTS
jgi:hypothetical protein